jgi:hypothetical protein
MKFLGLTKHDHGGFNLQNNPMKIKKINATMKKKKRKVQEWKVKIVIKSQKITKKNVNVK